MDVICEDNEKYPGNELFFLTTVLKASYFAIQLSYYTLKNKKFHEDHNYLHGKSMFISNIDKVIEKKYIPSKEKELLEIKAIVDKVWTLRDPVRYQKAKSIKQEYERKGTFRSSHKCCVIAS